MAFTTARRVGFAARRLLRSRVLVVGAYRSEDVGKSGVDAVRRLSECDHHELSGLSPHEVRELYLHTAGTVPGESTLEQLVARSEGNPLFVKELSRASSDGSRLSHGLPEAIREERRVRFMQVQEAISRARIERKVGSVQRVLIDQVGPTVSVGRSQADAPEIDGVVYVKTRRKLAVGDFIDVRITATDVHDLRGVPA